MPTLEEIRESEKKAHLQMYHDNMLYASANWLKKPVKTVMDILPSFQNHEKLRILDLGCGVGRNSLAIAQFFKNADCKIDCVDILDDAIAKLVTYAQVLQLSQHIQGIVSSIEDYPIDENAYDFILAVSALEHVDTTETFMQKLSQIQAGTRNGGIICLIINTNIREYDKATQLPLPAQFEVNLPSQEMMGLLRRIFQGWNIQKETLKTQHYDIPREHGTSELVTDVLTFVAKK